MVCGVCASGSGEVERLAAWNEAGDASCIEDGDKEARSGNRLRVDGRRGTLSDRRTSRRSPDLADLRDESDNSMALLVQLLLSLDRRDLAQSTYTQAKRVGNDSALVQAMEAWIGLKTVSLGTRSLCSAPSRPSLSNKLALQRSLLLTVHTLTHRARDRYTSRTTTTKSYTSSLPAAHRPCLLRMLRRTCSSDTRTRRRRISPRQCNATAGTKRGTCSRSLRRCDWKDRLGECLFPTSLQRL